MDGPIDSRSRTIKNHGQKFALRLLKQLARKGERDGDVSLSEDQVQCHRRALTKAIERA